MTRREQSDKLKEIVKRVMKVKKVSVRCGRGTAHAWKTIILQRSPTEKERAMIISEGEKLNLWGHYFTDYGLKNVEDTFNPNVLFQTDHGRVL